MYHKVFDGNFAGNLVGDKVSLKAAFAFASMIFNADQEGIVTGWYLPKGPMNCTHPEWEALVDELCQAMLIERLFTRMPIAALQSGGAVMDTILQYRILNFELPERIDRLSPEAWARLRDAVFARDAYTCQYCQRKGIPLECDHIVPLIKGGTNEAGNLITSCEDCNRSKGGKQLGEWRGRNNSAGASFETFWKAFGSAGGKKTGKGQAEKVWKRLNPDHALLTAILMALKTQQQERADFDDAGQFYAAWKHPATWLNAKCWLDEVQTPEQKKTLLRFTTETDSTVIIAACRKRNIDTVGKTRQELLRKLNVA